MLGPLIVLQIVIELVHSMLIQRLLGVPRSAPPLPAPDQDLLSRSGTELAARIIRGDFTSVALTRRCIARIEQVNPVLNAVVATRFDAALAEAATADRIIAELRSFEPGLDLHAATYPLWGVRNHQRLLLICNHQLIH